MPFPRLCCRTLPSHQLQPIEVPQRIEQLTVLTNPIHYRFLSLNFFFIFYDSRISSIVTKTQDFPKVVFCNLGNCIVCILSFWSLWGRCRDWVLSKGWVKLYGSASLAFAWCVERMKWENLKGKGSSW